MNGLRLIAMLTLMGLLAACGGGSVGNATVAVKDVDSDVAKGSTLTAGVCSGFTIISDPVTALFTTFPQKGAAPQIWIDSVTISFSPKDSNSPALPNQFEVINQPISVGNTTPVTFRLVSQEFKNSPPLSTLPCSNTIYSYYVTLSFIAHDSLGSVSIDPARLNVRFADFAG